MLKKTGGAPSYTSVFSKALIDLAENKPELVAITAAMPTGTGLKAFQERYPRRFLDVGIAEEHAMTLAAGLAADGKHPVVALYSTFAQRAYDQLIHDVCLQKLPVTLCLDRAGLVGEDGPTHHGAFDLSYLRHMPNMTVFVPKDENELRHMLAKAVSMDTPTAIRYPRGAGTGVEIQDDIQDIAIGKAQIIHFGGEIAFLAVGTMNSVAAEAVEILKEQGIDSGLFNMRFVKPLDEELLKELGTSRKLLVTLEENVLAGRFGSAVAEFMLDRGLSAGLMRFGLPDAFVEQGSRQELLELTGLTSKNVAEKVKARLQSISK
jgi:1-deoxy-D-xylulose-5-phosphate synthase